MLFPGVDRKRAKDLKLNGKRRQDQLATYGTTIECVLTSHSTETETCHSPTGLLPIIKTCDASPSVSAVAPIALSIERRVWSEGRS